MKMGLASLLPPAILAPFFAHVFSMSCEYFQKNFPCNGTNYFVLCSPAEVEGTDRRAGIPQRRIGL
jgi:hypothetical protein